MKKLIAVLLFLAVCGFAQTQPTSITNEQRIEQLTTQVDRIAVQSKEVVHQLGVSQGVGGAVIIMLLIFTVVAMMRRPARLDFHAGGEVMRSGAFELRRGEQVLTDVEGRKWRAAQIAPNVAIAIVAEEDDKKHVDDDTHGHPLR